MNKWTEVRDILDELYKVHPQRPSALRKVGNHYDKRTEERVITFEYRAKVGSRGFSRLPPSRRKQTPRKKPESQLELLQKINQRAVAHKGTAKGPEAP